MVIKDPKDRIKANERKWKKEEQLRRARVSEWPLETPTMKTHSADAILSWAYFVGLSVASSYIKSSASTPQEKPKRMRWKVYIHRLKTIDEVCKSMPGDDSNSKLLFAVSWRMQDKTHIIYDGQVFRKHETYKFWLAFI